MNIYTYLLKLLKKPNNKVPKEKNIFLNEGFHGDKYLQDLVYRIISEFNISYFIETRTYVGSTLAFVGGKYNHLKCFSCESENSLYQHAIKNTKELSNVNIYNSDSINFLNKIKQEVNREAAVLFWIDTNSYDFTWPIKKEIELITNHFPNAFIFIDDFKVPNQPQFLYNVYENQECSFEFIKNQINSSETYKVIYPHYYKKTSTFHPLKGWLLLTSCKDFYISRDESLNYFQLVYKNNTILYYTKGEYNSVGINNKDLIDKYTKKPEFLFLVSFPRTGSHWLRNIMELYFERPSLTRIFYFYDKTNFTCLHTHDDELDVTRNNVLYLYRDPIDTIFSQLKYYKEDIDSEERILFWTKYYARHLKKWLINNSNIDKITILKYEKLKNDIENEFEKICSHFNEKLDKEKLYDIYKKLSKEKIRIKTQNNKQVINNETNYEIEREKFRNKYKEVIEGEIFNMEPQLKEYL